MALGRLGGKASGVLSRSSTNGMRAFKSGRHLNTRRRGPGKSSFVTNMKRQRYNFRASRMARRIDRRV